MDMKRFSDDKTSTSSFGDTTFRKKNSRQNKLVIGVLIVLLIGIIIGLAVGIPVSNNDPHEQAARDVLAEYPLIDGHNDLPWQYRQYTKNKVYTANLRENTSMQWPDTLNMTFNMVRIPPQTDIPRLRKGMVGAQFWAAFGTCDSVGKDAVRIGMDQVDVIHKFVKKYDDTFEMVTTAQGILDAFGRNKIASLIGLESGHLIGNTLGVLRSYYNLGVRYMTLTHSCDTSWAENWKQDSNRTGDIRGLTEFGKIVVKEMNRLGMMVDLSHVSKQTMIDALDTSEAPVIFSHSSAYAKCNNYRNVQDDVLLKVKDNKGLVMVNFYDGYISKGCAPINATTSTIDHVIQHIDYIKDLIGVDYVGIGADYDGVPTLPEGLEDVSTYPALFKELSSRGWAREDLKKLAGRNLIRVFKEVEAVRDAKKDIQPYEDIIPEDEVIPDRKCFSSNV